MPRCGIDRRTGTAYERLLTNLHVLTPLTAWRRNELARLVDRPKRHLVDAAFVGPLLGLDTAGLLGRGDLLGPVLETFVVSQLRPLVAVSAVAPTMHHLRDGASRRQARGSGCGRTH